jgi:nucleoside-diphosphate-sugar epimerase
MRKLKALIVGCTGKLGSELLKVLHDPFDLDVCLRLDTSRSSLMQAVVFCQKSKKQFRLDDYDVIINCAWVAGVSRKSLLENILISKLLLRGEKRGSYVYLSTIDVYGDNQIDAYQCSPRTVFAFNKLKTELAICETQSSRTKVVLRVGNFISIEQLAVDSMSQVFESQVDRARRANLVDVAALTLKIESIVKGHSESGRTLVLNCVSEPNRQWGEVIDTVKSAFTAQSSASIVFILNSKGPCPLVFRYVKNDGVVSIGVSLVTLRVFVLRLLSPFIAPPVARDIMHQSNIELKRFYQDYTVRN